MCNASSAEIIRFPGRRHHRLHRCDDPSCTICEWGLAACVVCGGGEASLPTDCPGELMPFGLERSVGAGETDYRQAVGWISIGAGEQEAGHGR